MASPRNVSRSVRSCPGRNRSAATPALMEHYPPFVRTTFNISTSYFEFLPLLPCFRRRRRQRVFDVDAYQTTSTVVYFLSPSAHGSFVKNLSRTIHAPHGPLVNLSPPHAHGPRRCFDPPQPLSAANQRTHGVPLQAWQDACTEFYQKSHKIGGFGSNYLMYWGCCQNCVDNTGCKSGLRCVDGVCRGENSWEGAARSVRRGA